MMELTYASDAEYGFLAHNSKHLSMDPLMPGERAMFITSHDGEGVTLIGSLAELRLFAARLNGFLAEQA